MGEALLASVAAFAATNLDDLLVLMLLFGQAEDRLSRGKIYLGQLLGIGVLTLASVVAALGLRMVPEQYVRLLGAVPILLGVRAWLDRDGEAESASAVGVLPTALLTVANGGDNLGVYIPLLTGFSAGQLALCAAVFAVMTLLWCLLASVLAGLPAVQRCIERYKRLLVPIVFLLLGLRILFRA